MDFNDLVGARIFSGIDMVEGKYGDEITYFILDDKTYRVEEDPSDGYRSYANGPYLDTEYKIKNVFEGVPVFAEMKPDDKWEKNDVLILKDVMTSEIILEVGTENVDDYYPYYISSYTPGAMSVNKNR